MYLKEESLYVSGLFHMASSCSKKIGFSYATATCFKKKNFINSFQNFYEIKEEIKLKKINVSLDKFLTRIYGKNKGIIDGLTHWIRFDFGNTLNIYSVNKNIIDLLSGENKGLSPFYFCEDVFFIECEKIVICMLIGNDE